MSRTKKEIIDWAYNSREGFFELYSEAGPDHYADNYNPKNRLIAHTKDHTGKHIYTFGTMEECIEDADFLVTIKINSDAFRVMCGLLDRVFGSSDSWPDEYCDTIGWRLK